MHGGTIFLVHTPDLKRVLAAFHDVIVSFIPES